MITEKTRLHSFIGTISLVGLVLFFYGFNVPLSAQTVYTFEIKEEITPAAWRKANKAITEAEKLKVDYLLVHLNTYGGQVDMADSIRTRLLNTSLKTIVFIDNNAASAGALISIACKRIYMRKGASIGAASVVNQTGEVMPEKYQSYMRSIMRATAEASGRNPQIAEGFVDADLVIDSIKPKGKVITFTTSEAQRYGFCDGVAETIDEVLKAEGLKSYRITAQQTDWLDAVIGMLINPAVSGILILLILGGIYYELQAPGIGFALLVSVVAASLYFAPLYLEGLAANWEVLLFVIGIVLLLLEIFVIPGFGVAGVAGIVCVVCGLAFSLVFNDWFNFTPTSGTSLTMAFGIVFLSIIGAVVLSVAFGQSILKSTLFTRLVLTDEQRSSDGYQVAASEINITGKQGIAVTVLRPSGKIEVDGVRYDAVSEMGMIDKDTPIVVVKHATTSIVVRVA